MSILLQRIYLISLFWAAIALVPVQAGAQSDSTTLISGIWRGALRLDADGQPTSCYLSSAKGRKFTVILVWNRLGFHVVLHSKKWSLLQDDGEEFRGRVRIRGKFNDLVNATVIDPSTIDYAFGLDEPSVESFQSGQRITLEGPAGKKSFQLTGTRKAVDVLMNCADRYLSGRDQAPDAVVAQPDYEDGATAYRNKDYAGALRNWRPLAKAGDVRAQNGLGVLYYSGLGVPESNVRAARWFRKAAKQGLSPAQNNLGEMYRDGQGVEQSDIKAARWFRKAAEQGHEGAAKNLDDMITSGRATHRDRRPLASVVAANTLSFADNPESRNGRPVVFVGSLIDVDFTAMATLGARSWVGFVDETAIENPRPYHYSQQDINGRTGGVMTLEVPRRLGNYRLWMYDRANAKALVDMPIRIAVDTQSAGLDVIGGVALTPGQDFDVRFSASPNYSSHVWIGIVGTGTARDIPQSDIGTILGRTYLGGKTEGQLTLTAPTAPGHYLLRMQEREFAKTLTQVELVVSAPVAAPPVPAAAVPVSRPTIEPTQPVFEPGTEIEVRFDGLPGTGQDWLAISAVGQGPQQYFDLIMLTGKPTQGRHRFKPLPEGDYEIRVYTNWPDGGYEIAASAQVTVKRRPAMPAPAIPLTVPVPGVLLPMPPVAATPVPSVPLPSAPKLPGPKSETKTGGSALDMSGD